MPSLEPQPAATLVAIAGLFATVLALWIRPWWVLLAALMVTAVAAVSTFRRTEAPWQRLLAFAVVAVMAGLLAAHAMSGFQNPVVLRDVVLSPGAMPYTQYVNVDKTLAGVLILAIGSFAPLRPVGGLARGARAGGADRRVDHRSRHGRVARVWLRAVRAAVDPCVLGVGADQPAADVRQRGGAVPRVPAARGRVGDGRSRLRGRRSRWRSARSPSAWPTPAGGWRYVVLATLAGSGYALASISEADGSRRRSSPTSR